MWGIRGNDVPLHLTMRQLAAFLLFLLLLLSCTDGERMRQRLNDLQAANQADSLLTDDSLAFALTDYFDRHGTPNEQMLAHYLLGRTYADMGEAPAALGEYHRAAECADTTSSDCDYRLLTRVHAQSANLFYGQMMPYEMLSELDEMYSSAQKANDTLSWICAVEWRSIGYDLLGKTDSVKYSLLKAYEEYSNNGYQDMAVNCLPVLIDHYVTKGNYVQAKKYIDAYEANAMCFQGKRISEGKEIYYYYLGNYYTGIHLLDSAELCYRAALATKSTNAKEAALKGLYELFQRQGRVDSVAKYAALCYQFNEERFKESSAEELRHMHSLYNYTRNQTIAAQMTIKAQRNRHQLIVALLVALFVTTALSYTIVSVRRRKKKELLTLREKYQSEIALQIKVKNEILQLQKKDYEALLKQKEEEVTEHQSAIEAMRSSIKPGSSIEPQIANTDIYRRFEHLAVNYNKRVYVDDWNHLSDMIDAMLPNFRPTLYAQYHLDEEDYHLCMLIRLHFTLQQMGILLKKSSIDLSKRRKYLLSKMYHQQGKPETFDKIVKSIS